MPIPIISVGQMRDWEQASWVAGRSQPEVIGRVGEIVARRINELVLPGELVVILAGKGNNGEDARAASKYLSELRVAVCNVTEPENALAEIEEWLGKKPALIVDGLFGIGINRPLDHKWQKLIKRVNEYPGQILAVDVPSGLNADTGEPEGEAIRAAITLTLAAPKRGLLLASAWPYAGRLEVAVEIGLIACPHTSELNWTLPADFENYPPPRPAASHKGTFGHAGIFAGSLGYHGAAVLAAHGAQRAQPGLITLHTMPETYLPIAAQMQGVMVSPIHSHEHLPDDYDARLIGPGFAAKDLPDSMKRLARKFWQESDAPVIVDASAMDWLPNPSPERDAIRVVTPHPGEAARLLDTTSQQVQSNRPKALREISRRLGNCWVVLKGSQTLIGRSTGDLIVNSSGNPHLAQGGSGDTLGGYLTGLLAQSALQKNPLRTLAYGVWQHGAAADRLTARRKNWVVEDLAAELGNGPGR